jgi:hypothetical protein
MSHDDELDEASRDIEHFLKTSFTLSWCRIDEEDGCSDQLSQSQMHVDDRDEEVMAA